MADVLEVKNELSHVIDYGIITEDLRKNVDADLSITINGLDDKSGYKLADTRRKAWIKLRTGIDKRRKEMNAAAFEQQQAEHKTAIERLSKCKALLYFKGFLTESENAKVQQRLLKWVSASRKEPKS